MGSSVPTDLLSVPREFDCRGNVIQVFVLLVLKLYPEAMAALIPGSPTTFPSSTILKHSGTAV